MRNLGLIKEFVTMAPELIKGLCGWSERIKKHLIQAVVEKKHK